MFVVGRECFLGSCSCKYVLDSLTVSMKPCRVFTECFMWGSVDVNWWYMLEWAVFGFRVINPDCPCEYVNEKYSSIPEESHKKFMNDIYGPSS